MAYECQGFTDGQLLTAECLNKMERGIEEACNKPGTPGPAGPPGPPGETGKTPKKGIDYYTDVDKAEMVNAVLAALPDAAGVSY